MVFSGYMPSSGIAGSYGNSMFNCWRTVRLFSKSAAPFSHSHQQCRRVPISPHSHQHLLSVIFIIAILASVKCYLVFLVCISLIANDVEHLYIHLCLWLLVHLLCRNVYSDPLPIFVRVDMRNIKFTISTIFKCTI